nr:transcription termination factor mtef1, chloroplastic [Quercus suber]
MLLLSDPGKTLLPKIEFFLSKVGVSSSDLSRILTSSPFLLVRSLDNHLIPCYNFLKSVLVVDEKVLTTLKRSQLSFLFDVTNNMVPNIALLREFGVPESAISFLVTNFPGTAFIKHAKFVKAVQEVKEMGFDPLKLVFVLAIQVILKMKKPIWESKLELYKRWGWSKDVALLAFRRYPNCVLLSEEKITKTMDFLVHKMGCPSAEIAKNPSVLDGSSGCRNSIGEDTSLISHRLTSSLPLPGTIFYLVLDQKSNTAATTAANTTTQINNLTNDRAKEII